MAILLAFIAASAWSVFDLKRKQLASYIQPLRLAAGLAAAVTPFYLLLFLLNGDAGPEAGYWLPAIASLLVTSLAAVGFIQGLKVGRIALLIPILSISPIIAGLTSFFFFSETLSLMQWFAMLAIVVAIFFLNGGLKFSPGPGAGLMVLVACGWAIGLVFDKVALQYSTPFFHGFAQSLGMLLVLGAVVLLRQGKPKLSELKVFLDHKNSFAFAVISFLLAVSTQLYALQILHPGIVETVKRAVGMFGAILWGKLIFKEEVHGWQVALIVLIALAVGLLLI